MIIKCIELNVLIVFSTLRLAKAGRDETDFGLDCRQAGIFLLEAVVEKINVIIFSDI